MRAVFSAGQLQLARRLSASSAAAAAAAPHLGASAPSLAAVLASPFTYRAALVRGLSPAFAASALRGAAADIDQARAAAQHSSYVAALKAVVPHVIELPAADGCADSVFVEDTAVVLGGVALLTAPGAPSRAGETAAVGAALRALGYAVRDAPAGARLDGGDVLFTGAELFVGLSARSNARGAEALAAAFPGVPVTAVPLSAALAGAHGRERRRAASRERMALLARAGVGGPALRGGGAAAASAAAGPLHLKSLMSVVSPGVVAVADTPAGHALAQALQAHSKRGDRRFHRPLAFLLVPDAQAANAVLANGHLLARAEFPASAALLRDMLAVESGSGGEEDAAAASAAKLTLLDTSELALADGALTCCSILLH
jgi:dimethylargininase